MNTIRVVICLIGLGALGCDTNFSAFSEDPSPPFHVIDGFIDTAADTQFVRVQRVRIDLEREAPVRDEFAVATRSLEDGSTQVWKDSLVSLDDGSLAHLFYAVFSPVDGVRYEITVEDRDGSSTAVVTRVPPSPSLVLDEPNLVLQASTQVALLSGLVEAPPEMAVVYHVTLPEDSTEQAVAIPYNPLGRRRSNGWEFDVFLSGDRFGVLSVLGRPLDDRSVILRFISVDFVLLSEEWNATLPAEEQAVGFFGSVGRYSQSWTLDAEAITIVGYDP